MEGLDLSKLPIDLLLNILNIVLLFFITKKLVYKPVRKFLDDRTERVNAAKADAENAKAEADRAKAEYENRTAGISEEAARLTDEARAKANEEAKEIIAKANAEAERIVGKAKEDADGEKQKAVLAAKDDIMDLAFGISEKVLGRSVSDEDNMKIAEAFFKE